LKVNLRPLLEYNLQIGESISLSGACHTLEKLEGEEGYFYCSQETLNKTNFRYLRPDHRLNLELSLTPSTRMGGHLVSGHVDALAKLLSIKRIGESHDIHLQAPSHLSKYIIKKGSVCLEGISLTVSEIEKDSDIFSIAVIPHTWTETNLQYHHVGSLLNLEIDMIAKYVEKLTLSYNDNNTQ